MKLETPEGRNQFSSTRSLHNKRAGIRSGGLKARNLDAVGNTEDPLFRRKFADEVPFQAPPCSPRVSSANEGQRGISASVLEDNVWATWMISQKVCAVVDEIVDHHPAIIRGIMPSDFVHINRSKLLRFFLLHDTLVCQVQERRLGEHRVTQIERSNGQTQQVHLINRDTVAGSEIKRSE